MKVLLLLVVLVAATSAQTSEATQASVTTPSISICHPPILSSAFKLSFEYACREGRSFETCKGKVFWNGKVIDHITPNDYKVHTFFLWVTVRVGENSLKFVGHGWSDCFGLTIDNVKLVRSGTTENICINPGFEYPNVDGKWNVFNDIPGWWGHGFEIGSGKIYNHRWNSQICELDGHRNGFLSQEWAFDQYYHLRRRFNGTQH